MKNILKKFTLLSFVLSFTAFAGELKEGVLHVDAAAAWQQLEREPSVQVLDVRTPKEFFEGHMKGAINIDYRADDFKAQISKLDPSTTYLVHCHSGGRSGKSLALLKTAGITKLIHLDGGIKGWKKAGFALQSMEPLTKKPSS